MNVGLAQGLEENLLAKLRDQLLKILKLGLGSSDCVLIIVIASHGISGDSFAFGGVRGSHLSRDDDRV